MTCIHQCLYEALGVDKFRNRIHRSWVKLVLSGLIWCVITGNKRAGIFPRGVQPPPVVSGALYLSAISGAHREGKEKDAPLICWPHLFFWRCMPLTDLGFSVVCHSFPDEEARTEAKNHELYGESSLKHALNGELAMCLAVYVRSRLAAFSCLTCVTH